MASTFMPDDRSPVPAGGSHSLCLTAIWVVRTIAAVWLTLVGLRAAIAIAVDLAPLPFLRK